MDVLSIRKCVRLDEVGWRGPGSSPGRGYVLFSWARHFTLQLFTSKDRSIKGSRKLPGQPIKNA